MIKNKLIAIAAITYDGILGVDGDLAIRSKHDMSWFKSKTSGHTVMMGRKTFDSIGSRALPDRDNIVVTRQDLGSTDHTFYYTDSILGAFRYHSLKEKKSDLFVIGGGELYRQLVPLCDEAYITVFLPTDPADVWHHWAADDCTTFPYRVILPDYPDVKLSNPAEYGVANLGSFFKKYEIIDSFVEDDVKGIIIKFSKV